MLLRHILVVDDNDADLLFARIVLTAAGVADAVVFKETGQSALDHLVSAAGQEVDIVLLDINMPEMSGFEFLDRYQPLYEQGLARANVVMHSSSSAPTDKTRAAAYGCVKAYLVKPMSKSLAQTLVPLAPAARPSERA